MVTSACADETMPPSRTIADLEGSDAITVGHLSESINYRTLAMKGQVLGPDIGSSTWSVSAFRSV